MACNRCGGELAQFESFRCIAPECLTFATAEATLDREARELHALWYRPLAPELKVLDEAAKAAILVGFGSATRAELRRALDEHEGKAAPWVPEVATVQCPNCPAQYQVMEPEEGWDMAMASATCPFCQHETMWDLEDDSDGIEEAMSRAELAADVALREELRSLVNACRRDDPTAERVRALLERSQP